MTDESERAVFNGIDGGTGRYFFDELGVEAIAAAARAEPASRLRASESFGFPYDVDDPSALDQTGWAVIWPEGTPLAVQAALRPLLDLRKKEVGKPQLFKELDWKKGEDVRAWLSRHDAPPGSIVPEKVPYHLLVVGGPESFAYELQYSLGVEYAVGRLALDEVKDYETYAQSVHDYETQAHVPSTKEVLYWGPRHDGDKATTLSSDFLLGPLHAGVAGEKSVAATLKFAAKALFGKDATKASLLAELHRKAAPSLLFTASHGMAFEKDHPLQSKSQGALLCQDWDGFGGVDASHYLAASDIDDGARVHGMIAFVFACFGAGTPTHDDFSFQPGVARRAFAAQPFVSALPKRLLGHPQGSALAVIGHVERAWGYSIQPPGIGAEVAPFRNTLGRLMKGARVGHAVRDFANRYTVLSQQLLQLLKEETVKTDNVLAARWMERNDAQNYVVLGDPAVRLRAEDLA